MLNLRQILVRPSTAALALVLVGGTAISGCGQKGPLYLPSGPTATGRSTLPEVLNPTRSDPATPSPAVTPVVPASPALAPASAAR
jgi:predicted small lipoprotein YifL